MPDFEADRERFSTPQNYRPVKRASRWPARMMIASWVVGLLWTAVYYTMPDAPVVRELHNWNLLVGYLFLGLGVALGIGLLLRR
ncbi:cell division protein CrgA [Planomonospora sp. ID67723]|uniref:cell division protein CrgA n=1 Tax=Planomonospora sp. ID67723 TaxID=2738134 RepID=UPI0018C42A79|nr:cell division protein CrgA [Planomonospora sp. ID67723]MBG0831764.1 cell division protein CrgA [Planomonospora sp. ID67723]